MEQTGRPDIDDRSHALASSHLLVWLVAGLTFLAGLLSVVRPLAERLPDRLSDSLAQIDTSNTSLLILALGITLMYLGYELTQRKLLAWYIATSLVGLSLFLHLLFGTQYFTAALMGAVLASLVITRSQFKSKLHKTNFRQAISLIGLSLTGAIMYGTAGFWYLSRHDFGQTFGFWQSLGRTLREYLLIGNNDLTAHTVYGRWFLRSLVLVGAFSLGYAVFNIFRPLRYRLQVLPADRQKAQKLLERYGGEADDFFKLWPQDKSYFFSSDGRAFVAYGIARGIAVCFAGPVGSPKSVNLLIDEFKAFCLHNGWLAVFAQATDRFGKNLEIAGFNSLLIGADAVIDLDVFLTKTIRNKYFRNIVNRFNKQTYKFEELQPPHSDQVINEVRQVSKSWQSRAGRKQWRFFTGHFAKAYLQQTALSVVRDPKGRMLAFTNELPCYKKGEATIDLMRHHRNIPPNLMDWLFIKLFEQLKQEGYKYFNLGLSTLGGKEVATKPSDKFIYFLFSANQKIIAFKGLHQYKAKFEPQWQPRYLYYQGSAARLPQIGLAVVKLIRY